MSHVVLARKYRPKSFSEVVGQDLIVTTLKSSIATGRVAHALLFTGGRGIGKTTIARIVAKAVVCLNSRDAEPCGSCAQCLSIDDFSSLDVIEIDGASHTSVDDVRELRDSARYQPASAKYKIFIIDEVHMLSTSAFNALLKILEEPPPHVMFIFATTEVHKIPKTILSRTQRYDFRRMAPETILPLLKSVMAQEQVVVDDEGLRLVANLADGSMRDALSMLEQVCTARNQHYSAETVATTLGVVSSHAVKELASALMQGQVDEALLLVKSIYEQALDLGQLMDALAERFRILSLCAHVEPKNVRAIVPAIDDSDMLLAKNHDKADLKRLFSMSIEGMSQVLSAHKPLLAIELLVLRMALRPPMGDAITINYCLQKLDAIMHNRPLPVEPVPQLQVKEPVAQVAERKQAPIAAPVRETGDTGQHFTTLITELDRSLPGLASHLRHARPLLHAHELTLHFDQVLHYEQTEQQRSNKILTEAIEKIFGHKLTLTLQLKKATPTVKAIKTVWELDQERQKQEEKALYDRALDNPLVKEALKIFGGDVTSVKKVSSNPGPRAE